MVQFWRIPVSRVWESLFCRLLVLFFGSVFWFTGVRRLLPTAIILRVGMVFPSFC